MTNRDTPMTPEEVLGRIGLHLLNCDCGSAHWLLAADPKGRFIIVSCAMCYSCSGPLVPQDSRDLKLLNQASDELADKQEEDNRSELSDDWGQAISSSASKKKRDPGSLN